MKALIIGAAGFVGNYLIDELQRSFPCNIFASKLPRHELQRDDIEAVDLNVLDAEEVEKTILNIAPDFLFYLAAQSSIATSWKDPIGTVNVNVGGSLHVLNAVRKLESTRMLLVGSGEEYGLVSPECVPIKEDVFLNPQNIYAATKACQNMMASVFCSAYDMQLIMVRAFNHMGPSQSNRFVVSDFCHQAARIEAGLQEPIIRVGNLKARRDFTDVRDVVRAYVKLIQFGVPGETYNVGSGQAVSIQSILDEVIRCSDAKIEVVVDSNKLRPIEAPVIEADISKLHAATGWKPEITLSKTIQDTLNYWRSELQKGKA